METIILPKKYKNIGELFNSQEFIAFKEKCMNDYQTYMNKNKKCNTSLIIKLPTGKITFSKMENMNDFFSNIPSGGSIIGLKGENKINYYSLVNTLMRFCILTELTENICNN